MQALQIADLHLLGICQPAVVPEAYLGQVRGLVGYHPEFYLLVGVYTGYSQFNAVDGDFAVGVGCSLFLDAEDILRGFEGNGRLP